MTDYEIEAARKAFDHVLSVGAPGLSADMRTVLTTNAVIRLRHQFNVPATPLAVRGETPMERSTGNRKYPREEDCEDNDEGA